MSSGPFPERVEANKLFARHGRVLATLPLQRLTRLLPLLASEVGSLDVDLQFGIAEDGIKVLEGSIAGHIDLVCQRCLGPLPFKVDCRMALQVFDTRADMARRLPAGEADSLERDVLVLDESAETESDVSDRSELDLLALVEDDVLLSLPLAAMHEDENCSEALQRLRKDSDAAERRALAEQESPFAVLAQWKKQTE